MNNDLIPIINIDWKGFPIFNLLVGIAFLFSSVLYLFNLKKIEDFKKNKERSILIFSLSFVLGLILSNFFNWFIFTENYKMSIIEKIKNSGFTFYFGLISFILFFSTIIKINKMDLKKYSDSICPSIPLFHSIGRIGCMLGGCCFGKIINLKILNIEFIRFPVREIESISLFLLFLILQFIVKENKLLYYLIIYSILRFFLEYFRGDERGINVFGVFSISQFLSILILIISTFLIIKIKFGSFYEIYKQYNNK